MLFGATILGEGAKHTRLSRLAMAAANRRGAMSNRDDRLADLDAALGRVFASHETRIVGAVALFHAHAPA